MVKLFLESYLVNFYDLIVTLVSYSEKARREGLLTLEDDVSELEIDFFKKGIQLVVDGTDPELVRQVLEIEYLTSIEHLDYNLSIWKEFLIFLTFENPHEEECKSYLETLFYYSDETKKELDNIFLDFSKEYRSYRENKDHSWNENFLSHPLIGVNIKALNFYKYKHFKDILENQFIFYKKMLKRIFLIIIEGCLSIQSGDNPRIVKEKLAAFLLAEERVALKDDGSAEVLRDIDVRKESTVIGSIEEDDIELAGEFEKRMYVFEDIVFLDDRTIQKVIREVDNNDLIIALKGTTNDEVHKKIFKNISKRATALLREDMEFIGTVTLVDAKDSQQKIINIIKKLEEAGEIVVPRLGGGEIVGSLLSQEDINALLAPV